MQGWNPAKIFGPARTASEAKRADLINCRRVIVWVSREAAKARRKSRGRYVDCLPSRSLRPCVRPFFPFAPSRLRGMVLHFPLCDQARFPSGGGTAFRENFSLQLTFAVVTMRMPSVMIAPIVIVSPVSPSKKKL